MSPIAIARRDQEIYRDSLTLDFPDLVRGLSDIVGKKITAVIGKAKSTATVDRWIEGGEPYKVDKARIQLAYQVAKLIVAFDHKRVVQAWLIGLNPELDDAVPMLLLRDGNLETDGKRVLGAARAFCQGG